MASNHWNPKRPEVLGMEWGPLFQRDVPLDQSLEYGQTMWSDSERFEQSAYLYFSQPPDAPSRFHILSTIYKTGAELAVGTVRRELCYVNNGALAAGAALGGGAATITQAVASPADAYYIDMPVGSNVIFEFGTTGLFTLKRILRLVLHHAIEVVATAGHSERGVAAMINTIPGSAPLGTLRTASPVVGNQEAITTNLGEINPMPPDGSLSTATPFRMPWTYGDMEAFDSGFLKVWLFGDTDGARRLHYLALEVVYCDENREAVGATRFGSVASAGIEIPYVGYTAPPGSIPASAKHANLYSLDLAKSPYWHKLAGQQYTMTWCIADTGGPYDSDPGLVIGERMDQTGPVPLMPTLDDFEVFSQHRGRTMRRGPDNEPLDLGETSRLTPILLIPGPQTDVQTYFVQVQAQVFAGIVNATQEIQQYAAGPITPYPFVKFWARRFGNSADLSVFVDTEHTTITPAAFDALPEIVDGWREVRLRFDIPPNFTDDGSNKTITFTAGGFVADRWEILGAKSNAFTGTYGQDTAAATVNSAARDVYEDVALSFATLPPNVANLAVEAGVLELPVVVPAGCGTTKIIDSLDYVRLSWTADQGGDFAYYEVQRKDTKDPVWRTIGKVRPLFPSATLYPSEDLYPGVGSGLYPGAIFPGEDVFPGGGAPGFVDVEARVEIESSYRVRVVRYDGTEGDWSAEVTYTLTRTEARIPAGTLLFTSNVSPYLSCVFCEVTEGSLERSFKFPEADEVRFERFYLRDFQTAFRPTERGGTSFSRVLVVADTTEAVDAPSADEAFARLRDLAWADLPYVCVRDQLGNRWFAVVTVPDGTIAAQRSVSLAAVTITQATAEPSDGGLTV